MTEYSGKQLPGAPCPSLKILMNDWKLEIWPKKNQKPASLLLKLAASTGKQGSQLHFSGVKWLLIGLTAFCCCCLQSYSSTAPNTTTSSFLPFLSQEMTEELFVLGEGRRAEVSFSVRLSPCMSNLAWSKFSQLNYKPCKQGFMMEMLTQP